jgi:alpha-L-fucosidase
MIVTIQENYVITNGMTIDKRSWGYRRDAKLEDYLIVQELILEMAGTVR